MPFYKLYYHLVWSTKYREPVLTPNLEAILYRHIRRKASELEGDVLASNGWVDHIHLVVKIPPKISVAAFIRQVKGYSTAMLNKSGHTAVPVYWQTEYAAFSIDRHSLSRVIDYVNNQKRHHRGTGVN